MTVLQYDKTPFDVRNGTIACIMNVINPNKQLDAMLDRSISSQLPVTVTRESYQRALFHGKIEGQRGATLWACSKTGARFHAQMTLRAIFNRKTQRLEHYRAPVVVLYCSSCDAKPQVKSGDPIYSDTLMSCAM